MTKGPRWQHRSFRTPDRPKPVAAASPPRAPRGGLLNRGVWVVGLVASIAGLVAFGADYFAPPDIHVVAGGPAFTPTLQIRNGSHLSQMHAVAVSCDSRAFTFTTVDRRPLDLLVAFDPTQTHQQSEAQAISVRPQQPINYVCDLSRMVKSTRELAPGGVTELVLKLTVDVSYDVQVGPMVFHHHLTGLPFDLHRRMAGGSDAVIEGPTLR